jgi:hypothetical protein
MSITVRGIPLTQPQLDAIVPLLNVRPMLRGKLLEAVCEVVMAAAGHALYGPEPPPEKKQRRRRAREK